MANCSKVLIGYSKISRLLDEFGIEYSKNKTKPINLNPDNVTSGFFNKIRRGEYFDGYKECRDRFDYDYLLTNGSIFLFELWKDTDDNINKLF